MKKAVFAATALTAIFASGIASAESDVPKPDQVQVCASCHGEDGNSQAAIFPKLAGQHRNYLLKALMEYKAGERKNAIMGAQVANLTPKDMKALALWYSSQKAALYTVDPEPKEGAEHKPAAAPAAAAATEKK